MRGKETNRQKAGWTRRSMLQMAIAAVTFPFTRIFAAVGGAMEIKRSGSQPVGQRVASDYLLSVNSPCKFCRL
jgi:hypothetical protein